MKTYNEVQPIALKRKNKGRGQKNRKNDVSTRVPSREQEKPADSNLSEANDSISYLRAKLLAERRPYIMAESKERQNSSTNGTVSSEVNYAPDFENILAPLRHLIKSPLPESFYRFVEKMYLAGKKAHLSQHKMEIVDKNIRSLLRMAINKNALFKNNWDQQPLTQAFQKSANTRKGCLRCFLSDKELEELIRCIPYQELDIVPPVIGEELLDDEPTYSNPGSIITLETSSNIPPPPPPIDERPLPPWAMKNSSPLPSTATSERHIKSLPVQAPLVKMEEQRSLSPPSGSELSEISGNLKKHAFMDEESKRKRRLQKFADSQTGQTADIHSKRIKIDDDDNYSDLNSITNKAYKFDKNKPIIGLCEVLEKKYLRLTSEPDPYKVRPLRVLKNAFDWIVNKFVHNECSYQYFCDQMKSIRQDLKVQMIENDFTANVYKTHARVALNSSDIGEYNQCQSSLKSLFELPGIDKGDLPEFISYRILYHMMTSDYASLNQIRVELLTRLKHIRKYPIVRRALAMSEAQIEGNYHTFMKLYEETSGSERHLINQFIKKERIYALDNMCKAYSRISLNFLAPELRFNDANEAFQFLTDLELIQYMVIPDGNPDEIYLDARKCRPNISKHFSASKRVDIKGQI